MNVLMQIVLEFDDAPQTLLCFFLFLSCRLFCHFFISFFFFRHFFAFFRNTVEILCCCSTIVVVVVSFFLIGDSDN